MRCGAAPGTGAGRGARPGASSPAAEWMRVISSTSACVGGGRMPVSRRASMVLPEPGGPVMSRLWAPAAAISSARRARVWPRTSARSAIAIGTGGGGGRDRLGLVAVVQDVDDVAQAAGGDHGHGARQGRLGRALRGDDERVGPHPPRGLGHRERAAHGPQGAVEPELGRGRHPRHPIARRLPRCGQQREGDREIEPRALLALLGGSQVHRQPPHREVELGRGDAAAHALARLLDGAVGQADDDERRHAVGDVGLDVDPPCGDPREPERERARDHGSSVGRGAVTGG